MDFSDPIPRDATFYQPEVPKETADENKKERERAEQAIPFIDGVIEWFDDAITNTNSLEAARTEAKRREISIEVAVEAYDIVREILMTKRGEFESLKMTFDT